MNGGFSKFPEKSPWSRFWTALFGLQPDDPSVRSQSHFISWYYHTIHYRQKRVMDSFCDGSYYTVDFLPNSFVKFFSITWFQLTLVSPSVDLRKPLIGPLVRGSRTSFPSTSAMVVLQMKKSLKVSFSWLSCPLF